MMCATEAFYPHTNIPPEAIFEFLNVRAPPDVPASHPLAWDRSFDGENLRPTVERRGRWLTIEPADERLPRKIDMYRDLEDVLHELSTFNQEPAFPSYPDPFSISELTKEADELFPQLNHVPDHDDGSRVFNRLQLEPLAFAELGAGYYIPNPAQGWYADNFYWQYGDDAAPSAPGAQGFAAPKPVLGYPTCLPDYASPGTLSDKNEGGNDTSASAKHTPLPMHKTLLLALEAPVTDYKTEDISASMINQSAATGDPSTSTISTIISATPGDGNSAGPSTLPAQEAPFTDRDAQTSNAQVDEIPAGATSSTPGLATTADNRARQNSFSCAGPFTARATCDLAQASELSGQETRPVHTPTDITSKRKRRAKAAPKVAPPPPGQYLYLFDPVPEPSAFPAAASSSAPSRTLGNGASIAKFRTELPEPKQYQYHEHMEKKNKSKTSRKAGKKSGSWRK